MVFLSVGLAQPVRSCVPLTGCRKMECKGDITESGGCLCDLYGGAQDAGGSILLLLAMLAVSRNIAS